MELRSTTTATLPLIRLPWSEGIASEVGYSKWTMEETKQLMGTAPVMQLIESWCDVMKWLYEMIILETESEEYLSEAR